MPEISNFVIARLYAPTSLKPPIKLADKLKSSLTEELKNMTKDEKEERAKNIKDRYHLMTSFDKILADTENLHRKAKRAQRGERRTARQLTQRQLEFKEQHDHLVLTQQVLMDNAMFGEDTGDADNVNSTCVTKNEDVGVMRSASTGTISTANYSRTGNSLIRNIMCVFYQNKGVILFYSR